MTSKLCQKSIEILQGITDLFCDISVLSSAFSSLNGQNLSQEENQALCQLSLMTQTGAEALELRITSQMELPDDCKDNDLFVRQEVEVLKVLVNEVTLLKLLLAKSDFPMISDNRITSFESQYLTWKLGRKINKLQMVFLGLDCQQKTSEGRCNSQPYCLIFASKAKRIEVQHYA